MKKQWQLISETLQVSLGQAKDGPPYKIKSSINIYFRVLFLLHVHKESLKVPENPIYKSTVVGVVQES